MPLHKRLYTPATQQHLPLYKRFHTQDTISSSTSSSSSAKLFLFLPSDNLSWHSFYSAHQSLEYSDYFDERRGVARQN